MVLVFQRTGVVMLRLEAQSFEACFDYLQRLRGS